MSGFQQENFEEGTEEGVSAAAPHAQGPIENSMDQEEHKNNFIENNAQAAQAAGVVIEENAGSQEQDNMDEENQDVEDDGEEFNNADENIDEEKNLQEQTEEQAASKQELINQALKFKEYWERFNEEFDTSLSTTYFLLSKNWLKTWKKHVSYERVIQGKEPIYEYFGKQGSKLSNANKDLILTTVEEDTEQYYEYVDKNCDGSTIILKPQLKEILNYIIVDRDIINLFDQYEGFQCIPRRAYKTPDGKKRIEIYYRKVNLVILNHNLLKDIDNTKVKQLECKKVQLFSAENQEELKHFLCPIVKKHQYHANFTYNSTSINLQTIRLWKLNDGDNIKAIYDDLHTKTRRFTSFEYRLKSPLVFTERNNDNTVEELDIPDNCTLFVEVQKQNGWFFKLEGEPDEDQCEFCRNYKILKYECRCKKVKYCTESCKLRDQEYHARVCDMAGEESEDDANQPYKFESDSVRGQCGLQNLGNTCFMNSALQCMSNTLPLSIYFLKKTFLQEINEQNVLGTQGKLAKQYAKFIKNLWTNNSRVFSPIALKMAVAKVQSMFSGYQQHDSQEFLSYILDGLHEDLNRVKQKQYTESIDSNGRPDSVVSKESWLNHMKRNQSIIVDLMQGQFKSKVTCPDCKKESITFDPFLTCSLPIPNKEVKMISFYLIFANNRKVAVEIKYQYDLDSPQTIKDLKDFVALKYSTESSKLNFFCLSFDRIKEHFNNETSLEQVRKSLKEPQKNALMIEYEEDLKEEENVQVSILFTRMREDQYIPKRSTKGTFTFIRPFYFKKNANKKDVHLALFKYLKPIFERGSAPDSEFVHDSKTLSLEDLYQKYIQVENPPYSLTIETDAYEYNDRPCSWCGDKKCKNCILPYNNDEDPLEEFINRSKSTYHSFKFDCFVDMNTELGKMTSSLHSLDHSHNNSQNNQKLDFAENKTNIYDCLKLFEQPEKLGEDNEWYCPECKKHQKAVKQIVIYRAPEILILHLKRFKGSGGLFKSKLTKVVDFPIQNLDMTEFVVEKETPSFYMNDQEYFKDVYIPPAVVPSNFGDHIDASLKDLTPAKEEFETESNSSPAEKLEEEEKNNNMEIENDKGEKKLLYDLYAITNHYGSLGFGHYTAYGKNNNRWFCYDDSNVKDVSQSELVSEASYILFYKRKN